MVKKQALGKGISALIPDYPEPSGQDDESTRIVYLNVDEIEPNPHQPRTIFDDQDLDGEGIDVGDLLTDEITPEDELEAEQTNEAIDRRVQAEGEPNVIRLWELVYRENYDLKHDRAELCEHLGLDPAVGGPDYQIFNRCRNRLKELVELGCQDCLVPV